MIPTPTKFNLVAGAGEGITELNAFDQALLVSGAGNLNLLKVSSILPPGATYNEDLYIPPGSLTPVAFAAKKSRNQGEKIAAAVAVGIPEDPASFGVIMEHSDVCSQEEVEEYIKDMVRAGFDIREIRLKEIKVVAVEHRVIDCGAVFAGLLLWY